jgi:hypothetical protein
VDVAVTPEAAFAAVTDWPGQSRWVALTRVRVARGDGRSAGSVIEAFTGVGRAGFLDVMEVVAWEPPHRVDVLHVGRVVRGPGTMRVEKLSDRRAVIVWQEWLHLPLGRFGRLAWPVVRFCAAVGLRRSLRVLKRGLEAQR